MIVYFSKIKKIWKQKTITIQKGIERLYIEFFSYGKKNYSLMSISVEMVLVGIRRGLEFGWFPFLPHLIP